MRPAPSGSCCTALRGTKRTLRVRVLAETEYPAPQVTRRLNFFFRSGAHVPSKWVSEGERTLREIFIEAQNRAPSIIFVDKVDGLAPPRSSGVDHERSSLVTVLLGLMDGPASRGDVILCGRQEPCRGGEPRAAPVRSL